MKHDLQIRIHQQDPLQLELHEMLARIDNVGNCPAAFCFVPIGSNIMQAEYDQIIPLLVNNVMKWLNVVKFHAPKTQLLDTMQFLPRKTTVGNARNLAVNV